MYVIAHSSYLTELHNGHGFWTFSGDSIRYHLEAISLIELLDSGQWGEWWLSFSPHAHVKWIALLYWIFDEDTPLIFEIVNATVWLISITLVYNSARILFDGNIKLACVASSFLFFPSILLSSTQLLRDPFYILGLCFITFGWVLVRRSRLQWEGLAAILIGYYLVIAIRSYIAPILFFIFSICVLYLIFKKMIRYFPGFCMLLLMYAFSFLTNSSLYYQSFQDKGTSEWAQRALKDLKGIDNNSMGAEKSFVRREKTFIREEKPFSREEKPSAKEVQSSVREEHASKKVVNNDIKNEANRLGQPVGFIEHWDRKITARINLFRYNFRVANLNAGSRIDTEVSYKTFKDLFVYLPRAFQVGFLSPFPIHWVTPGVETGYIGRTIAGIETCVIYFVWIGFIWVLFKETKVLKPLIPVLILSSFIILLLGFVVPNVGAIYRMRQALFVPFFIVGVYGIGLLYPVVKDLVQKYSFRRPA